MNITIQATTTNATYAVYQQQILPYFQKWNLLITTYNSSSVQVALLPICYSVNVTVNFVANQVLSSDVLVAVGESSIIISKVWEVRVRVRQPEVFISMKFQRYSQFRKLYYPWTQLLWKWTVFKFCDWYLSVRPSLVG